MRQWESVRAAATPQPTTVGRMPPLVDRLATRASLLATVGLRPTSVAPAPPMLPRPRAFNAGMRPAGKDRSGAVRFAGAESKGVMFVPVEHASASSPPTCSGQKTNSNRGMSSSSEISSHRKTEARIGSRVRAIAAGERRRQRPAAVRRQAAVETSHPGGPRSAPTGANSSSSVPGSSPDYEKAFCGGGTRERFFVILVVWTPFAERVAPIRCRNPGQPRRQVKPRHRASSPALPGRPDR
jgi:hypothetical protein